MNNPDELKNNGENPNEETSEQIEETTRQLQEMAQNIEKNKPDSVQSEEPFSAGKILKGGEFGIRELKDNPDKVVRTESMVGSVEETTAHYKNIKDRFEAMQTDYGVNVPDMDVVLGKDAKGKERVFMIVDKIDGKDLGELESLPAGEKDKFESFYTNFLQSIFDGYKKGKPFFKDVKIGNIMYGHKSKDKGTEEDFFLSDVGGGFQDDNFVEYQGQFIETGYDEGFFRSMMNARADLQDYEKKFGENAELKGIRDKLEEIYKYCKDNKQQELQTFFTKDPTAQNDFMGIESVATEGLEQQNKKEVIWQKKEQETEQIPHIEKGTIKIITALNLSEIPTSQSCEGHVQENEIGVTNPFVEISALNQPEKRFVGQERIIPRVAKKYGMKLEDVRTMILHSMPHEEFRGLKETESYKKWRKENKKIARRAGKLLKEFYQDLAVPENVRLTINEQDAGQFEITNTGREQEYPAEEQLAQYQREMDNFAAFLKEKYFEK
jgi:hypothetical protein